MADINIENIENLVIDGNDLFEDSESFIIELDDDDEQVAIMGGLALDGCTMCSHTCC